MPPVDALFWTMHWTHMDANYLEELQAWNMKLFDQFFEYCRKQGVNIRDYIAEHTLRYSEATTAGLELGNTARSYVMMKNARLDDEQRRWMLTPVQNDLQRFDEIVASAALKAKPPLKQPEPEPEPEPLTPREPAPQPEPEPSREDESAAALARLGALRDELAECSAHVAALSSSCEQTSSTRARRRLLSRATTEMHDRGSAEQHDTNE